MESTFLNCTGDEEFSDCGFISNRGIEHTLGTDGMNYRMGNVECMCRVGFYNIDIEKNNAESEFSIKSTTQKDTASY